MECRVTVISNTNKQTNKKTRAHLHTAKPKLNLFDLIYNKFTVPMLHPAIGPCSLYLTLSCYLAIYLFKDQSIYRSIYLLLTISTRWSPHHSRILTLCHNVLHGLSWNMFFPANASTVNLKVHWSKQSVGFKTTASYQCYLSSYFLGVIPTVRYIPKYILKRYQPAKCSYFFFFHFC